MIHDVTQFLTFVVAERNRQQPTVPVILLGVSWGGKLAAVVGGRRPDLCDGIALLYPGLKTHVTPSWWQRRLLKLAMATGKHRRQVPIPLDDPQLFTAEPEWQRFIREDKLALHQATVGFLSASVALDAEVPQAMRQIRRPLLMMLAGKDRIIDNPATQALFETVATPDRRLLVYEDAAHTLEFEPNRDRIIDDLITWMQQVSPPL